mmetsp:Transcript_5662/g.18382  ORF Transcript_5662/g.18382 Transcript_5662/m.18382 type:complete len:373 (+) Transcript_5662:464-1582(+)
MMPASTDRMPTVWSRSSSTRRAMDVRSRAQSSSVARSAVDRQARAGSAVNVTLSCTQSRPGFAAELTRKDTVMFASSPGYRSPTAQEMEPPSVVRPKARAVPAVDDTDANDTPVGSTKPKRSDTTTAFAGRTGAAGSVSACRTVTMWVSGSPAITGSTESTLVMSRLGRPMRPTVATSYSSVRLRDVDASASAGTTSDTHPSSTIASCAPGTVSSASTAKETVTTPAGSRSPDSSSVPVADPLAAATPKPDQVAAPSMVGGSATTTPMSGYASCTVSSVPARTHEGPSLVSATDRTVVGDSHATTAGLGEPAAATTSVTSLTTFTSPTATAGDTASGVVAVADAEQVKGASVSAHASTWYSSCSVVDCHAPR